MDKQAILNALSKPPAPRQTRPPARAVNPKSNSLSVSVTRHCQDLIVPHVTGRGKEAKITAAKRDISNIKTALKMFEMNCNRFPTSEEGLRALIEAPGNLPGWKGPYLDQQSVPLDPWQNPYVYRSPGQHNNDFDLYSYGPDGQDGGGDDIDNWSNPAQH